MALPGGPERIYRYEIEVARRRAELAQDPIRFIWEYVRIESGDIGSPLIPFELWPAQAGFIRAVEGNSKIIAGKSRQIGLTWLVLGWMAHEMLFKPGFAAVGISREEDSAKELVRRIGEVILPNLPAWLTQDYRVADMRWNGPRYQVQTMMIQIHHPRKNGRQQPKSRFIGEQSSPESGRSFTANALLLDEWAIQEYAEQIWTAAYPIVNKPNFSGKVIGISTAKVNSFFHKVWNDAVRHKNGFTPIFLNWRSDPRRTRDWYEQVKRDMPLVYRQEYPETPADMFSVGAQRFFAHDYERNTCEPFEIPDDWWLFRCLDWGHNSAACCLWIAVDEDGTFWVYRELYITGMTARSFARAMKDLEDLGNDEVEDVNIGPADNQIRQRGGTEGPTVEEEFADEDVFWEESNKDRVAGWHQIHGRLGGAGDGKARLVIFRTCENLLREMDNAEQNTHKPDDLSPKCSDHALDALRYACMYRPFVPENEVDEDPFQRVWKMPSKRSKGRTKGRTWMSR